MQSILQHRRVRNGATRDFEISHGRGTVAPSHDASSEVNSAEEGKRSPSEKGAIPGVQLSEVPVKGVGETFLVGWSDGDPENPMNWSRTKKWLVTTAVCLIAMAVSIPASIDGPVAPQFNNHYHVGAIAGSMTTGMYLIGIGVGSMFAAPFSETFGRNLIYFSTLIVFMLFTVGKALAPNYGAAIVFRFLVGFFGAAPLTVGGGTVGDIWGPLEITFSLPYVTMTSYAGPILGPIIGAYLPKIGFRWADWISLIIAGAVLVIVLLFQPETYSPTLLAVRAQRLRELTGDDRYQAAGMASTHSIGSRMWTNLVRPFSMTYTEPIILVFSLYLIIIYIVLFTFLNGFPYIFSVTYGISDELTFMIWTALLVGDVVAIPLIPIVYGWTKKAAVKAASKGENLAPEVCLYFAMLGGSILMPISLFWIGWTCRYHLHDDVHLYCICVPAVRRVCAVWLAAVTVVLAPLPFVLYKYGHKIRAMSKNVQNKG